MVDEDRKIFCGRPPAAPRGPRALPLDPARGSAPGPRTDRVKRGQRVTFIFGVAAKTAEDQTTILGSLGGGKGFRSVIASSIITPRLLTVNPIKNEDIRLTFLQTMLYSFTKGQRKSKDKSDLPVNRFLFLFFDKEASRI